MAKARTPKASANSSRLARGGTKVRMARSICAARVRRRRGGVEFEPDGAASPLLRGEFFQNLRQGGPSDVPLFGGDGFAQRFAHKCGEPPSDEQNQDDVQIRNNAVKNKHQQRSQDGFQQKVKENAFEHGVGRRGIN